MSNIIINSKGNTIEMTKKFAASAKRYGTEAYTQLQEVRRDYPNYRVIVKCSNSKKRDCYKGLTYSFMERYIMAHDDGNGSALAKFNNMRATSDEAKEYGAETMTYGEIKAWFLNEYPAFAEFQKKREALIA